MSTILPIIEDPRYRISTATDGQTVFSVPFPFQNNADVLVFRTGLDGQRQQLVEGLGYTITGAGNPIGGSITLVTPALAGEKILRLGQATLDRIMSVVRDGRFSSLAIDFDIDRFIIIAQELSRDLAQAWRADYGQTPGTVTVGAPGTTAMFDDAGNLGEGPTAEQIERAEEYALQAAAAAALIAAGAGAPVFATKALATAFSPTVAPDYLMLAGELAPGDGGDVIYVKAVSEPSHAGKFSITLSGGGTQWYEISWPSVKSAAECQLVYDAGNLKLKPYAGSRIAINRVVRTVPAAGVTLAATGLTPDTLYFIYAAYSAGNVVLEASATVPATDSATGMQIKTGDASRTLVGMARPVTGPAWASSPAKQLVRSWFHDKGLAGFNYLEADVTVADNSWVVLGDGDSWLEFLTWDNEGVQFTLSGAWTIAAASGALAGVGVGVDSASDPLPGWSFAGSPYISSGLNSVPITGNPLVNLSLGHHVATMLGRSFDGEDAVFRGGPPPGGHSGLAVVSRAAGNGEALATGFRVNVILRNTGAGWFALDDADHTPENVVMITQTSTAVRIWFAQTARVVRGFHTSVDDTFATEDQLMAGASTGLTYASIVMSRAGTPGVLNPSSVISELGNIQYTAWLDY